MESTPRRIEWMAIVLLLCFSISPAAAGARPCGGPGEVYLADKTEHIVLARILDLESRTNDTNVVSTSIYTTIVFETEETLKGAVPPVFSVVVPGGVVGGRISGFGSFKLPFFAIGSRLLVYLRRSETPGVYFVDHNYYLLDGEKVVEAYDLHEKNLGSAIGLAEGHLRDRTLALIECNEPNSIATRSDQVLVGQVRTVREVEPERPGRQREYVVEVLEPLKLTGEQAPLGAIVVSVFNYDEVEMEIGARVVLFLNERRDGIFRIVGKGNGVYSLQAERAVGRARSFTLTEFRSLVSTGKH